ncbi:MAG TPA: T9SS type A sorting domain-containing protein [Bacteroidales bacterium]|nr:T9SS type A sorting domain-containing protein [Bacteroidales bacterium]
MKQIAVTLISICLFSFGSFVQAQEAIPASGGNATGTGGTSSYTVGQLDYASYYDSGGKINAGVQHPFEISEITGIKEASGIILECSVFPNPSTDFLMIKVENYDSKNLSYRLYDVNGNLLENKKIEGNETQVWMRKFASGAYFIKVTDDIKEIKTFKIIKN